MKKIEIKGIIPPVVTPIDEKENINYEDFKRVLDHVIDGGVHGVFPLGSNGEFYAHDIDTQKAIIAFTVKYVDGRVPVYAGATHITTRGAIALAKSAEEVGADAISVLSPMFIQPTEEQMYEHFKAIADSTKLPVILYNNPGKTNNDISVKLLKKLAEIPNIVAIKNTTLNFAQTLQYIEATKDINNFDVLSGIDYYIYSSLAHGSVGAVAGTANVAPKLVVDIYNKYMKGDLREAMESQQKLIPLRDAFNCGTFPVVAKDCLRIMEIISGTAVKPVTSCSETKINYLRNVLEKLELIN